MQPFERIKEDIGYLKRDIWALLKLDGYSEIAEQEIKDLYKELELIIKSNYGYNIRY